MKKKIFSLMAGVIVALASCSKSDEMPTAPQSGEQLATFNIEAPATRGDVNGLTRYIVEAYEGKDLTKTPIREEAAIGELTLTLKKNTEYTFVFWADKGTAKSESVASSGYWNTDNLLQVVVTAGKESAIGEVAYCYAASFNSKDFEANKAVTLKNATAQINFVEAYGLTAANNSLTVKYSKSGKLNVATGVITEISGEVTRTYSSIGKIAKDGIMVTDYILAPLNEKSVIDLKVTFNTESEKAVAGVPFQQSYKTNLKGEFSNKYSSVFTVSNEVEDYIDDEVEFPIKAKVGDFYMKDGTWLPQATELTVEQKDNCIGIVYVVNSDGKSGKIVSLDESSGVWGPGTEVTGATSETDGAANTTKVLALSSYTTNKDQYPIFKWCEDKKTSGVNWYIPAKDELLELFAAADTINPSLEKYSDSSNKIDNMKSPGFYCSSTESSAADAQYYSFKGQMATGSKGNGCNARAISVF